MGKKNNPLQIRRNYKVNLRIRRTVNESSQLLNSSNHFNSTISSTSEPSPASEGTSEPRPESGSTSEPRPESDSTSEPSPESDSTSEPSPESDISSEPSPESESTSEPSPASESTSEPRPESDSTSEPSPESDISSEPSPESDSTSEPSPESDSTSEPSPESDSTSEPSPESDSTSEPSPESDSTSEPSPESDISSEPSPESDSTSEPRPESDSTSEPRPESDSTSEPSPESDISSEPSPESEGTSEPSPEGDSTSEPSPEGDSTSEPSPESDSTSEPNPEGPDTSVPENKATAESEPEPKPEAWPEPGPEWKEAYKLWRNAWPAHTYFFSIIFLLMAFYSGYYIVVNIKDGLGQKYLSISLNVMMCALCTTRSFVLFVDPYHQGTLIADKLILQLMWSIGTPCLLASDSLCILALAESANVTLTQQRFQRLPNILVVIFLHFTLVIATDIVVSSHSSAKVMILYCQVFSIIWGTLLGLWYFTLAHKINHVLFKAAGRRKSRGDRIYLLLIYLSSAANLFTCVLILYSAVGVFGIYSEVEFVDAWPWYTLQSGMRTSEVIAALLVFTVSAKRNRMKNKVHNAIVCQPQETKETSDTSGSVPTVNNLYPAPRSRRMSMFSAVHQSKISAYDNPGDDLTLDSPLHLQSPNMFANGNKSNPVPRGRRMSLFSELHESKLSATHVNVTPQQNRSHFLALNQLQCTPRERQNLSVRPTNDTGQRSGQGRRMSMFSQLQELKMSANGDHSTPSTLESKITPPSVSRQSESGNQNMPSNRSRRMSMFSQLQEIKISTNVNNSLPSASESEKENANLKTPGFFSGLQNLFESRKNADKSEEFEENSQHSNFFSRFFRIKVPSVGTTPPKVCGKLDKITALCRSVGTVSTQEYTNDETDVNGNDMPTSRGNKRVRHVIDMPATHNHVTATPNAQGIMRDIHENDVPNARASRKNIEWTRSTGSRTSLFAGLRETNTKLEELKIMEDDEEEVEEQNILVQQDAQVLNQRKCSLRSSSGANDRNTDITKQNMTADSSSVC